MLVILSPGTPPVCGSKARVADRVCSGFPLPVFPVSLRFHHVVAGVGASRAGSGGGQACCGCSVLGKLRTPSPSPVSKQALLRRGRDLEEKILYTYDKHRRKLHFGTGNKCFKIVLFDIALLLLLPPWGIEMLIRWYENKVSKRSCFSSLLLGTSGLTP